MTDSQPGLGVELAEVTKGMISLHRRFYGKGPTKAKTYAVNDTVICVLEGGFTTVERTLIDEDDLEAVLQVRRSFQAAMEGQFTEVVEKALGRKVVAYMSQIHADPDMAVKIEAASEAVTTRRQMATSSIRPVICTLPPSV